MAPLHLTLCQLVPLHYMRRISVEILPVIYSSCSLWQPIFSGLLLTPMCESLLPLVSTVTTELDALLELSCLVASEGGFFCGHWRYRWPLLPHLKHDGGSWVFDPGDSLNAAPLLLLCAGGLRGSKSIFLLWPGMSCICRSCFVALQLL